MNTKSESKSRAIAMLCFDWMLCSQIPLFLTELATVADAWYILRFCSNFIISDSSEIAQFAQLSVREYL